MSTELLDPGPSHPHFLLAPFNPDDPLPYVELSQFNLDTLGTEGLPDFELNESDGLNQGLFENETGDATGFEWAAEGGRFLGGGNGVDEVFGGGEGVGRVCEEVGGLVGDGGRGLSIEIHKGIEGHVGGSGEFIEVLTADGLEDTASTLHGGEPNHFTGTNNNIEGINEGNEEVNLAIGYENVVSTMSPMQSTSTYDVTEGLGEDNAAGDLATEELENAASLIEEEFPNQIILAHDDIEEHNEGNEDLNLLAGEDENEGVPMAETLPRQSILGFGEGTCDFRILAIEEENAGVPLAGHFPKKSIFEFDEENEDSNPMTEEQENVGAPPAEGFPEKLIFGFNEENEGSNLARAGNEKLESPIAEKIPELATPNPFVIENSQERNAENGMDENTEDTMGHNMDVFATPHSISSPEIGDMPTPHEIPYKLRPEARINPVPMTWLDEDETGNYDPVEERRQLLAAARKKRQKIQSNNTADNDDIPRKPRTSLVVTLQLPSENIESESGRQLLLDFDDNWPVFYIDTQSEGPDEVNEDYPTICRWSRYIRIKLKPKPLPPPLDVLPDPRGEEADLTGHPAARGCVDCRRLNVVCPLRLHGNSWPCYQCIEDDIECVLITPPSVKGSCQRCKGFGLPCSFANGGSQDGLCAQCVDARLTRCNPGPASDEPTRIFMDGRDRKYTACTACRAAKKRCSLKSKTDETPCNWCRKSGVECTFEEIPKLKSKLKMVPAKRQRAESEDRMLDSQDGMLRLSFSPSAPPRKRHRHDGSDRENADHNENEPADNVEPRARSPTPSIWMADTSGHSGKTTTLTTPWCHPITFSTTSSPSSPPICAFCADAAFAWSGHGDISVHCIEWANGLGYTELFGGHQGAGRRPTFMCEACTLRRVAVLCCEGHQMERMQGVEPIEGLDEAMGAMLRMQEAQEQGGDVEVEEVVRQTERWCALCLSLASFQCGRRMNPEAESVIGMSGGCGLRLCERCSRWLREEFGGCFQSLVSKLRREGWPEGSEEPIGVEDHWELMVRKDIEFLDEEGLLFRCVAGEAGEAGVAGVRWGNGAGPVEG
ncbi:hypothetical protein K432DRAFT_43476 [Lepidopterella palustris CBS 459.81]|uniref:Zn(2)-C6 fungal-type domain-containing protein n=1 Tax=Lepidopterella palustris CBS 459.81 TaxID=1314670 RepID=A0A8E2EAK0_9PEZI|nr:hypothetical protein K432DRAFT_43476 [Lepidopterella palustris CBS 459.81]